MIINKYNSAKGNNLTRAGISTGAISSDSSSSGGVSSLDRVLWGQTDDGEDIDGSMWINGSLYLGAIDYGSEDDEETTTDAGDIFVDDAETGSLIADALVQSRDMYCKEHPYITYPIVGGKKTDLRELFNGFDERIKTNATNIKTNTTNIATNKTNISTNATNIAANTAEITKLKSRVTTNETNIKTNTTNISTNATNIKNLDKRVTTNATNIKTNTTNITGLDTRVTAIETNVTDLSASVDTNTTDITTLKTDVSTNTTDISTLSTKVTTNTTNISTNTTDIKNIDTRVTKLENKVADKSDYEDLKTKVDTNTTNITNIKNEIKNLQDAMPVGSIIMYNGKAEEIPSGWAICDGENGTPNLIDRFILGSNICGSTGGASQVTLSVSQLPPHKHRVSKCWYGKADNANDRQVVRWDESIGTNEQVMTGETGLGMPIDIMPPYYRLIYIMKVGTTDTTQTT